MLRPNVNIIIGDYLIESVKDLNITSSWDNLTDGGVVALPVKLKFKNESITAGVDNFFKRGDSIYIYMGYYPNLKRIFTGFVTSVSSESPIRITFDDYSFLLKESNIATKSLDNLNLAGVLPEILPEGIDYEAVDTTSLGRLRIKNVSSAFILESLRKYSLRFWFRFSTLYAGQAYNSDLSSTYNISLEDDVIKNDLTYQKAEDRKLKIKAISIDTSTNVKTEIEVGSEGGDVITQTYINLSSSELQRIATESLNELLYTGYSGSIMIFGEPAINHGDKVNITSLRYPENDGLYYVDQVETMFGDGMTQTLRLGAKTSA